MVCLLHIDGVHPERLIKELVMDLFDCSIESPCADCRADKGLYDFTNECCRVRYLKGEVLRGTVKGWLEMFSQRWGDESTARVRLAVKAYANTLKIEGVHHEQA